MPVSVKQTAFNNFEALQSIVQDGRSDLLQLGRGRMSGKLTYLGLGPQVGISTGTFSRGMRARGVLNSSRWTLAMLLEASGDATAQHHLERAGDLTMIAPGEDRYVSFQDSTSYSAFYIDPQELETFLSSHPGAKDVPMLRQPVTVMVADRATAAANVKQLSPLLAMLIEAGPTLPDETVEFYKRAGPAADHLSTPQATLRCPHRAAVCRAYSDGEADRNGAWFLRTRQVRVRLSTDVR